MNYMKAQKDSSRKSGKQYTHTYIEKFNKKRKIIKNWKEILVLNNTMNETKHNAMESIKTRLDQAEEVISEIKDSIFEIIQS